MSSLSRVADLSSVQTNQSKTSTARRPGIAPPPVPAVNSTTATQLIGNGTSSYTEDDDRSKRSLEGVAPVPRPPPPRRKSSIPPTSDPDNYSSGTSNIYEQWNDVNQDHVIFNVMTFVVMGRRELDGSMLNIDYRDPVEHGSEVKDSQTGTVYRRKPNGVYFRLTSAGGTGDQLRVGDEVLAVAGYQLADMSLETARILLDDQDGEKGISVTIARLKELSNNDSKISASQNSTEVRVQTSDVINYTESPVVAPPRRKKSARQNNNNESVTKQFDRWSHGVSSVDEQNDSDTMATVIRIDSNGNIEMDKTEFEDDEQLMIGEDFRQSIPDEHTASNAGENKFRVTANCDYESGPSDRDKNSVADFTITDNQSGRGRSPYVIITSTTELNSTGVELPSVFADDVPPPPLPSSMPPTSVPILPLAAQRPRTILLQTSFEEDVLLSPLKIVLPPPSPYAASPVDEVSPIAVSELISHESPVAITALPSPYAASPVDEVPPIPVFEVAPHDTSIVNTSPPQRFHIDLNDDELDLVKRAFTDEHFSYTMKPARPAEIPVRISTPETIDSTLVTSSSSPSLESTENKPTSDPRLTSYLSLIGGHGYSSRRQVASAVRSLVHRSSTSSSLSSSGTTGSSNSGENHHGNRENEPDPQEASREVIDHSAPGGRSPNYAFEHNIRSDSTRTELDDQCASIETTHVETTHVNKQVDSCIAACGIDNQQTITTSNNTLSSVTSKAAEGSTSSVNLGSDVTIATTSHETLHVGATRNKKALYTEKTKRVGEYVTSLAGVTSSDTEKKSDDFDTRSDVEDEPLGNTDDITATKTLDEDVYVVTSSETTSLSPPSDVIVDGTRVEPIENDVFDTVPTCPSVDELSPVTPTSYEALSKSRLSLRSDQAVSDILREYYSPCSGREVAEDISSKKTTPAKPIISQALLPRSLRGSSQTSQTVSVSTTSGVDYTVPVCLLKGAQEQGTINTTGKAIEKSGVSELHRTTSSEKKTSISEVSSPMPNQNSGSVLLSRPEVFKSSSNSSSEFIKPADDPRTETSIPDTTRLEITSSRAYFESLKDTVHNSKIRSSDAHRVEGQPLYPTHRTSSQTSHESSESSAVEHGDVPLTTNNRQSIELSHQSSVELVSKSVKNDLHGSDKVTSNAKPESNDELPKMADSKAFFESIQKNKVAAVPKRTQLVGRSTSLLSKSKVESPPVRSPASVSEVPITANKSEDTTSELPSMADSKAFFENLRKPQQQVSSPPPITAKPRVVQTVKSAQLSSPSTGLVAEAEEAEAPDHEAPRSTSHGDHHKSKDLGLIGGPVAKIDTPTRTSWTNLQWKPTISKTTIETSSSSISAAESPDMTTSVTGAKAFFESKATPPQPGPVRPVKRGSSMSAVDVAPKPAVRTTRPLPTASSTQLTPTLEVTVSSSDMSSSDAQSSIAAAEGRTSMSDNKASIQHRPSLTSQHGGDLKTKLWKQFLTDFGKQ